MCRLTEEQISYAKGLYARGLTYYDRKEPDRAKWVWGDILRNDVIPLMWKVNKEGYIDYAKEEENNGEETK